MKNTYLKIKNKKEFAKYVDLCLKAGYIWSDGSKDKVEKVWFGEDELPIYVNCIENLKGKFNIDIYYAGGSVEYYEREFTDLKLYNFNTLKNKLK